MTAPVDHMPPRSVEQGRSSRRYLLYMLAVVYALNNVDRIALGLLLQDIKVDLQLSDTQLGLLTGMAFALFYSIAGIKIARWADTGNRVKIIAIAMSLWSVAVSMCGLAASFVQLLLIRVGAAVGEAGCVPPAHSLIADYFNRSERPRAVAVFLLGAPLSMLIGYLMAGWLNQQYGWRWTFIIVGLPGLILAPVVWLTLHEPRRDRRPQTEVSAQEDAGPEKVTYRAVLAHLWSNRAFRHLLVCFAAASFFSNGLAKWQPAFFIRSFGVPVAELGVWFTFIYGIGSLAGIALGGRAATRYAAGDERVQLLAVSAVYVAVGAFSAATYLASDYRLALAYTASVVVLTSLVSAPTWAIIQSLMPDSMRAVAIAILLLVANLIGAGIGPLAVGILSDLMQPWAGSESLRYALLTMCPGYVWAAWHVWRASATVSGDLAPA